MQQTWIKGIQEKAWLSGKRDPQGIVQEIKIWPSTNQNPSKKKWRVWCDFEIQTDHLNPTRRPHNCWNRQEYLEETSSTEETCGHYDFGEKPLLRANITLSRRVKIIINDKQLIICLAFNSFKIFLLGFNI